MFQLVTILYSYFISFPDINSFFPIPLRVDIMNNKTIREARNAARRNDNTGSWLQGFTAAGERQ